jgi:hypothetical protein
MTGGVGDVVFISRFSVIALFDLWSWRWDLGVVVAYGGSQWCGGAFVGGRS